MFDPDLLERNPVAREGLKLLVQSGIILEQQDALKQRIAFGDPDEVNESVIANIKEFRRRYGMLESLQELGAGYIQENDA